ncbi:hypothetical protein C7M84_020229 [Penaeus vannamei]|uniref:Uncharacterized protein n=1 Tax=Penaeus vannamei TaxID=6689 RepID=A0A3R7P5Q7_PENVA|nr:hypothetical protein C7M84_020229 [Penaeus vannamei]
MPVTATAHAPGFTDGLTFDTLPRAITFRSRNLQQDTALRIRRRPVIGGGCLSAGLSEYGPSSTRVSPTPIPSSPSPRSIAPSPPSLPPSPSAPLSPPTTPFPSPPTARPLPPSPSLRPHPPLPHRQTRPPPPLSTQARSPADKIDTNSNMQTFHQMTPLHSSGYTQLCGILRLWLRPRGDRLCGPALCVQDVCVLQVKYLRERTRAENVEPSQGRRRSCASARHTDKLRGSPTGRLCNHEASPSSFSPSPPSSTSFSSSPPPLSSLSFSPVSLNFSPFYLLLLPQSPSLHPSSSLPSLLLPSLPQLFSTPPSTPPPPPSRLAALPPPPPHRRGTKPHNAHPEDKERRPDRRTAARVQAPPACFETAQVEELRGTPRPRRPEGALGLDTAAVRAQAGHATAAQLRHLLQHLHFLCLIHLIDVLHLLCRIQLSSMFSTTCVPYTSSPPPSSPPPLPPPPPRPLTVLHTSSRPRQTHAPLSFNLWKKKSFGN